jgi:Glycosyl hydrolase family 63 C-terminal domain
LRSDHKLADDLDIRIKSRDLLESNWDEVRGYCRPHPVKYPHMWLWDSCFHSIAWAALADRRVLVELSAVFREQFENGFLPHMVYAGPTISRGPKDNVSSFTQPPVYGQSLAASWSLGESEDKRQFTKRHLLQAAEKGLDYLWRYRRLENGLLFIVHPWESGADHSPRWDDWIAPAGELPEYDREVWESYDDLFVKAAIFSAEGDAQSSDRFVAAPAAFNAIAARAAAELFLLTGDEKWRKRSMEVGDAMDQILWDDRSELFKDDPVVGGGAGASASIPTLDGVLGALATNSASRASKVLDQLSDPSRFAAPYGPRYLPVDHERYRPDKYWRGPAWPQLNYLLFLACRRWDRDQLAVQLADVTRRGVRSADFSEFWNPETGQALALGRQTWSAVVVAMR